MLVFGAGAALLVLRSLVQAAPVGVALEGTGALRFGLHASVVAAAVALVAFVWSLAVVPRELPPKAYYEMLFWGGGHALQFTWTLLMLVAWLVLARACDARVPLSPRVVLLLFAIALASVFVTPLAYLMHDVSTVEHREMHTWGMRIGVGWRSRRWCSRCRSRCFQALRQAQGERWLRRSARCAPRCWRRCCCSSPVA